MRNLDKYLQFRGERWHYVRRIPDTYTHFDKRGTIRKSLKTKSLEIARAKRDGLVNADNEYWESISKTKIETKPVNPQARLNEQAIKRYEDANRRAMAKGFAYLTNAELIEGHDVSELLKRVEALEGDRLPVRKDAEALLGLVPKPHSTLSQAFEIYCQTIAISESQGKSAEQISNWHKVKLRAVNNFINVNGDLPMDKITGKHAVQFFMWWEKRIASVGIDARSANTANRDFGNMRNLYTEYWKYEEEPERANPFKGLSFSDT